MKTILVYCPKIAGHRLEYIHHLYEGAKEYKNKFIFALTKDFDKQKGKLIWEFNENIIFETIDSSFLTQSEDSKIKRALLNSQGLGYYAKKHKADEAIVLDLMEYVPFLSFFMPSCVKVKGIIYKIITYERENRRGLYRLLDKFKYWVMSKFKVYDSVFMLNDIDAPNVLNKQFSTNHFKYLPDPIIPITNIDNINIREYYKINPEKKIILHPGGMLPYKGTLEILEALKKIPCDQYDNFAFIFAGRVTPSIKENFYKLLQDIDEKLQIIVEDDFFSFERLGAFFKCADWILIPYTIKSQSSGIVGHAAIFRKPVIVVKNGLIGSIVEKHKLGVLIEDSSSSSIHQILLNLPDWDYVKNTYAETHKIGDFVHAIFRN